MKELYPNIAVLIPDVEDHELLVLQVINALALEKSVSLFIMSGKKYSYLKYSRYVKHFSYYPVSNDKDWINNINREIERFKIDVILPVFETGIKKLIRNKSLLKYPSKLCQLPNLENFKTGGEKGLLYNFMKINQIPCPESVISEGQKPPDISALTFPIIVKPVYGFGGGQRIKVLQDVHEFKSYCKSIDYSCNTIFQNYIRGFDISCNVLCENGQIRAYTMQKGNAYQGDEVTPQISFRFIENPDLLQLVQNLMTRLNWCGVANIDCRYDEDEQCFKIIEVNTRYWINVDASALAGINFPWSHCLSTVGEPVENKETLLINYLNLKGLVRKIAKQPTMLFKTNYVMNNTALVFAIKDPLPIVYKFFWRTKNIFVQKLVKNRVKSN